MSISLSVLSSCTPSMIPPKIDRRTDSILSNQRSLSRPSRGVCSTLYTNDSHFISSHALAHTSVNLFTSCFTRKSPTFMDGGYVVYSVYNSIGSCECGCGRKIDEDTIVRCLCGDYGDVICITSITCCENCGFSTCERCWFKCKLCDEIMCPTCSTDTGGGAYLGVYLCHPTLRYSFHLLGLPLACRLLPKLLPTS